MTEECKCSGNCNDCGKSEISSEEAFSNKEFAIFSCEEIGISGALFFDPARYDQVEMEEIGVMVARVVTAWYNRRGFIYANLDKMGIMVN